MTDEQNDIVEQLLKEATFAEESADWYRKKAREYEIEGRNLRSRIIFEKRYREVVHDD